MSTGSRRWQPEDLTPELRARIVGSPHQPISANGPAAHKFGAKETWVDNIRFKSKLEAGHYQELKLLKSAGQILWFIRQPQFDLPGGVKCRADFLVVWNGGAVEVFDSKGYDLPLGRLKRKQVKELYGIDIQLWTKPGSAAASIRELL